MSDDIVLPAQARVVIVGGGIAGLSVAYHLTKLGWRDVLLLERHKLTSGTTWHAAGLVGQLRATHNLTRLAKYTAELFARLEAETGVATGFRQRGSLAVAATDGRWTELKRGASMARHFGLEAHLLTPAEAKTAWPLLHVDDLVGGLFIPKDGQTNPVDTAMALARGARAGGARIVEGASVRGIATRHGAVAGVRTSHGDIAAEIVVNCAGLWGHSVGRMAGVTVPLHAAEHFYVVTEPIGGLSPDTPVLRDPDSANYFKEDAGKLLVGWFEPVARPWDERRTPDDFAFGTLPVDMDHIQPQLEKAAARVPRFGEAGIRTFFNGPESFTPDDRYLLGEAPELRNFFVACGFNSIGIQSSGGAGMVLAQWIVDGHPPMDLWDVDVRRAMPFQANRAYLRERTTETLGLLYAMHWPYRQVESARGVRRSPLYDRLAVLGACFGETAGWERANWFAAPDQAAEYAYSYDRQNWHEASGAEHRAARHAVALFDQTSFGKFLVQGRDAESVLSRICANDIAVAPGRVVYTQWLNPRGGIEADVTVTRIDATSFLVVTSAACQIRDLAWLRRHTPDDAHCMVTDVTSGYAVLGVMGPRSRQLLASLSPDDFADSAFPFMTSREVDLGHARVRASRVTYVGTLGWELYVPTEFAAQVFDTLFEAGDAHGLALAGYHALNSLRLECGYRHFGHDISDETTPLEAGLGFAVAFDKPGGFIGHAALSAQRGRPLARRLVSVVVDDPGPVLLHDEPIWRDGSRIGMTTSGMFGHTLGRSVGLGYVHHEAGVDAAWLAAGSWEVEIACERFPCRVSLRSPVDTRAVRG
ncbi:FAD-dependent oxidoreductase [Vineibacter terrae]|uniref:GcvT family protein n=1 Tax=Vineibacter terrae TaxID=2586908 RepID=UPI002E30FAB8|nr:FAD-dependent oxidoreductase [Vineibacter terrae]HEX2888753.1 FAD-dependent oxidoreductase [Vineibacter terrae]